MFSASPICSNTIGQIARNRVAPQPGLPAPVSQENAGLRAQRGVGVDDGTGEASIELRIGLVGIDLPQRHPAVRPRQIENAVREMPILILSGEAQCGVARFADAGHHIDRCRLLRIERHLLPDRDDRIEDRTLVADSLRASAIACGAATVRPRPMNCMRSVS